MSAASSFAVIAYFLGFDPGAVLNVAEQVAPQQETRDAPKGAPADEAGQFVAKVLGSTEEVWGKIFQQSKAHYRAPTLVLYDGQVRSACGTGQSAMGPVLLPRRREALYRPVVLPTTCRRAFGAPGDFAQAYVIAHEVGHHVQKLTGDLAGLEAARGGSSTRPTSTAISVRMELQADCYAGVWAHHAGT